MSEYGMCYDHDYYCPENDDRGCPFCTINKLEQRIAELEAFKAAVFADHAQPAPTDDMAQLKRRLARAEMHIQPGPAWDEYQEEVEALTEAKAQPAPTDELRHLAAKVARHRNVVCAGETACGDPDCGMVSHNHIVFKTKQARDDWESLLAALQEEVEAITEAKAQPAPTDEQIVKHYNTWLDSLEVQANFDDYPAFEAGYRAALQEEVEALTETKAQPAPTAEQIEGVILEHLGWSNGWANSPDSFYESVKDAAKAIAALQEVKE